jgi:hypothetical protein
MRPLRCTRHAAYSGRPTCPVTNLGGVGWVAQGTNNHLGHGSQHFRYNGPKPMPVWDPAPGTMTMDPKSTQCIKSHHDNATNETICDVPFGPRSMCGEEATTKATICDPKLRTVNVQAECGTPEDIYYYSPWRAPGSAPTIDACGSAGGAWCHFTRHALGVAALHSPYLLILCCAWLAGGDDSTMDGRSLPRPGPWWGGCAVQKLVRGDAGNGGLRSAQGPRGGHVAAWPQLRSRL